MRKIATSQLEPGMILGAPIVSNDSMIELLSKGTKLSKRHIALISQMSIEDVYILDHAEELDESVEMDLTDLANRAHTEGKPFDADKLQKALDEIETHVYEPATRSAVNANMAVHVLTGEGNVPIDVKHEEALLDTKKVIENIKDDGELDLDRIRRNVEETLPDMIRNNDVLMRLNQLKASDDYTFHHSLRVSILASMIGKWLGYSEPEILELAEAGLLFDMGKLHIPEFLLQKPGQVTPDEFELIKKHAQFGYSILLKTRGVSNNIKYAALHHHERMDGSGYPLRLRENQIHDFAKVIMVCDVFDALISDRPYKKAISPIMAAEYLSWTSGKLFDSKVCYVLIKKLSEFYLGKTVKLTNGDVGKIVFIEENYPTRPIVQVGEKFVNLIKERSINVETLM
ncbi:HD-GYP domain-containing protein [Fusibacter paucivorans]|uniref:HD-GYP domain-containing protein n=1 Tax=Fusibacter paucivorans TaxID=76009 RepID=A0ABS5PPV4_9FIRM|nr:HD-GYP domain-containing protein [Fusibacter paucivorans]